MSKAKQVHYNMDNIEKENANFNLIVGEKSNGKSYQVKHKVGVLHYMENKPEDIENIIDDAFKKGFRFILLRRWGEDISTLWIEQYFADVDVYKITDKKYNCISVYRKVLYFSNYNVETGKTQRGEKIGYVMALNQEQHMSSASFLDVDRIIFEEFVERGGKYLPQEPDRLMIFYSTIDRKRGTTKLYMVGNSITKVCPYFRAWGLDNIFRTIKQGEIKTLTIHNENNDVKLAVEFCGSSGGKTMAIGNASAMIDKGAWQTEPQPKLPKSKNEYKIMFTFGFYYKGFKFLCELLQDNKDFCFFIYPYYKEFDNKTLVFSDIIKPSPYWQGDIYNILHFNDKIKKLLYNFRESNIFYSDDLCGTDFKECINFSIRR